MDLIWLHNNLETKLLKDMAKNLFDYQVNVMDVVLNFLWSIA